MKITPQLLRTVRSFYKIRNELLVLENHLHPLKDYLLHKLDYGEHKLGEHILVKTHYEATEIAGYTRKSYDSLTVK